MQGKQVRTPELFVFGHVFVRAVRTPRAGMYDNARAKRRSAARRVGAEVAEPEDSERFSAHFEHGIVVIGKRGTFFPIPARDGSRIIDKASRARQKQGNRMLSDRVGGFVGGVGICDSERFRGVQVVVIEARG